MTAVGRPGRPTEMEGRPATATTVAPGLSHVMSQQLPCRMAHCPAGQFVGGQSMRHICIGESGHIAVAPPCTGRKVSTVCAGYGCGASTLVLL